jgi:uncharacterized protein YdcH (DUF465 family)
MLPGILSQLGKDKLEELKNQSLEYAKLAKKTEEGDEDIPDLVENFEETSKQ